MKLLIDKIEAFFFDFDGVLTNNLVYVDQEGKESVSCSRSDGLAFDILRKLKKPTFIISSEKNSVVTMRANKLKTKALLGITDKVKVIKKLAKDNNFKLKNILFVGNDLNDYNAIKICGYSACPSDSHKKIKALCDITLETNGGEGVVRDLIENVFNIDVLEILNDH